MVNLRLLKTGDRFSSISAALARSVVRESGRKPVVSVLPRPALWEEVVAPVSLRFLPLDCVWKSKRGASKNVQALVN